MTQNTSAERRKRLTSLAQLLSAGYIEKKVLLRALNYDSLDAFERDLRQLRSEYGAKIAYDRKHKAYKLIECGTLVPGAM